MDKFIFVNIFIFTLLFNFLPKEVFAQNYQYTCPLRVDDITGVMQWNDGWPFSVYGRATHGILPVYQPIDINGFFGSSVLSPAKGKVYRINRGDSFIPGGNEVVILGDDGRYYAMAHVTSPSVVEGDFVDTGSPIGNVIAKVDSKPCDLSQEFTDPLGECTKPHVHFDVYQGGYENPSSAFGLEFVARYCGLVRANDDNPEFPQLPTINCAKITGNPNINLCFSEKSSIAIAGDTNNNGCVGARDLGFVYGHYQTSVECTPSTSGFAPSPAFNGDFNHDGCVDDLDLSVVSSKFSYDCSE